MVLFIFSNTYNFSDTLKCFFAYNIDKDNITYLKFTMVLTPGYMP